MHTYIYKIYSCLAEKLNFDKLEVNAYLALHAKVLNMYFSVNTTMLNMCLTVFDLKWASGPRPRRGQMSVTDSDARKWRLAEKRYKREEKVCEITSGVLSSSRRYMIKVTGLWGKQHTKINIRKIKKKKVK